MKVGVRSTSLDSFLRIRAPSEWKVPINKGPWFLFLASCLPNTRSRISLAALLVKVIARMFSGRTPFFTNFFSLLVRV